jgi:NAD(P)-dependent dehydrogenase (short-subunit alcohol dehydrogenase family)
MELGLRNRVVLVTGASSGIGRAIAVAFAREGARVAITYRSNKAAAEETVTHINGAGGQGFAVPMDLTEPSGIDNAVAQIVKHWGHIDVLIGNAVRWGMVFGLPLQQIDAGELKAILSGNLEGTFHLLRAVLPSMVERKWGRIVLISRRGPDTHAPAVCSGGCCPYRSISGLSCEQQHIGRNCA